jgi:hypothetical protein
MFMSEKIPLVNNTDTEQTGITRRDLLKLGAVGVSSLLITPSL